VDIVVTVPKGQWESWIAEGDLPSEPWSGTAYEFTTGGGVPSVWPGDRVYIVAHGRLRGYAPLARLRSYDGGRVGFIRQGGAVAVTIQQEVRGFRGWRYRWWDRADEKPFPDWREVN